MAASCLRANYTGRITPAGPHVAAAGEGAAEAARHAMLAATPKRSHEQPPGGGRGRGRCSRLVVSLGDAEQALALRGSLEQGDPASRGTGREGGEEGHGQGGSAQCIAVHSDDEDAAKLAHVNRFGMAPMAPPAL